MSGADGDTCSSCLLSYNSKDRLPKILSCYHTYCRACLHQFMFQGQVITCLSCSKTTNADSVESLPENPYLRPSNTGEDNEVYYSDSDDDDDSTSLATPRPENGPVRGDYVRGIKDMLLNTQTKNVHRIQTSLDSTLGRLRSAREVRGQKEQTLQEAIKAVEQFKLKLGEELKNNQMQGNHLSMQESKAKALKNSLESIDPMDHKTIKSINEETMNIKKALKIEVNSSRHHDLEQSVRNSTVKINFEKSSELVANLKADNDTIFMKLASSLENDPGMVFLTTFMLGNIFSEKIASNNVGYKEMIQRAVMEEGMDMSSTLDDVSDYIEYINQHLRTTNIEEKSSPVRQQRAPPATSTQGSGKSSPTEWKVVSKPKNENKPKGEKKPISFSDMAKKPGQPKPVMRRVPFPEKTIAQTNRPHAYFKIQVDNEDPFRLVIELRPDMAPKMVDNFLKLCKGLPDGRGYQGSKLFRAKPNDHVLGGDFENNDGTGGASAFEEKYLLAEQCPLKDHKGAIRMKGLERTLDGRCKIASQFMIWVGDLEYKEYRFTLVFGKVVEGFDQLLEVSRIKAVQKSPTSWVLRQNVLIMESGQL